MELIPDLTFIPKIDPGKLKIRHMFHGTFDL